MKLPENYVVICNTQEETNEVINFKEPYNTKNWQFWDYVTISTNEWNIYSTKENSKRWFKNKDVSDYKTFTFKERKEMKENKTPPQYWYIKVTEETLDTVNKVRAKQPECNNPIKLDDWKYYGNKDSYNDFGGLVLSTVQEKNLLELSLEEFKSYFLQEEKEQKSKTMQKLTISVTELLEIHIIACSTWKTKIAHYLTRVDNNQNVTFTQQEVDEMFKAATNTQKPVLINIFGEKEIKTINGWFISANSKIYELKEAPKEKNSKNLWKTTEQAEACLAMSELSQLISEVNKEWIPNYLDGNERKYIIYFSNNKIETDYFYHPHRFLSFKTAEIRDKFLETHRELILKAKPLL